MRIVSILTNLYKRHLVKNAEKARQKALPVGIIQWKKESQEIFETFRLKNSKKRDIFVSVAESLSLSGDYKISIKDRFFRELGTEDIYFNKSKKAIEGLSINTKRSQRKNGYGEILRLMSVMMMMKNKQPGIEIFALDKAVIFHSKYKFQPAFTFISDTRSYLKKIAKVSEPSLQSFVKEAKELRTQLQSPDLENKVLSLIQRFLEKINQDKLKIKTDELFDINMVLKKEDVLRNKDFYNALYKKHGINFHIE